MSQITSQIINILKIKIKREGEGERERERESVRKKEMEYRRDIESREQNKQKITKTVFLRRIRFETKNLNK